MVDIGSLFGTYQAMKQHTRSARRDSEMWIISKVLHLQRHPALLCAPLITGVALVMSKMHCRRPVLPLPPFPFQLRILSTRSQKKIKTPFETSARKRSNPGSFWFTAVGGSFFQRHKNFRVASLASEWHKRCTSSTYCVSLLSYSIAVNIRRLQCNMSKQTASKQHVLALGLCG